MNIMQKSLKNIFFAFLLRTLIVKWEFIHSLQIKSGPSSVSFSYNYRNVSEWRNNYSGCDGKYQSPIDIHPVNIDADIKQNKLKFEGYEKLPERMTLKNNGHTVILDAEWSYSAPFVVSEGKKYIFESLHFHWGRNNYEGSEHTLLKRSFPLEMHMVHYKEKYGKAEEAQESDGTLVISILFEISETVKSNISPLAKSISLVKNENEIVEVKPFKLSDFDFHPKNGYLTYMGSLTTPPCTENIFWLLSTHILTVNQDEMNSFRAVKSASGDKFNFRPVQPLNGRKIVYLPFY